MIDIQADRAAALERVAARSAQVTLTTRARKVLFGDWTRPPEIMLEQARIEWPKLGEDELAAVVTEAERLQEERRLTVRRIDPEAGMQETRKIIRKYLEEHRATLTPAQQSNPKSWPGPAVGWAALGAKVKGICTESTFKSYHWSAVAKEMGLPRHPNAPGSKDGLTGRALRTAVEAGEDEQNNQTDPAPGGLNRIQSEEPHGASVIEQDDMIAKQVAANKDRAEQLEARRGAAAPRPAREGAHVAFQSTAGRFEAAEAPTGGSWTIKLDLTTADAAVVGEMVDRAFRWLMDPKLRSPEPLVDHGHALALRA